MPLSWKAAYRASLKDPELEESLDRFLYRPLAFLLVWPLRKTPVRPNHLSLGTLLLGLLAGVLFWQGTPDASLLAGAAFFVGNVLDCADGQLARLQNTASPFGYLVDGAADYGGATAAFLGMAHSLDLQRPAALSWLWLVVAAGLSMAWQCGFVDEKRREWLQRVHGRRGDRASELATLERSAAELERGAEKRIARLLVRLYRTYVVLLDRFFRGSRRGQDAPAAWGLQRRTVLRRSLWCGPTAHATGLVAAALINRPEVYLWAAVTAGNAWMAITLRAERAARRVPALS